MTRMLWACGIALMLATGAGCTTLAHPYDYCGPVYDDCGGSCDTLARAGSVLYPGGEMAPAVIGEGEVIMDEAATSMDGVVYEDSADGEITYETAQGEPHLAP